MFAPPPLQLTTEQIAQSKLEREAREAERAEKARLAQIKSAESADLAASLQRIDSGGSKASRKGGSFFRRGAKLKVSEPIAQQPRQEKEDAAPSPATLDALRQKTSKNNEEVVKVNGEQSAIAFLPLSFAAKPRKAPEPPKRPFRPTSELFLPPLPPMPALSALPPLPELPPAFRDQRASITQPPPKTSPPPVPERSPRRQSGPAPLPRSLTPLRRSSPLMEASVEDALVELKTSNAIVGEDQPALPHRSSVTPTSTKRKSSLMAIEPMTITVPKPKRASAMGLSSPKTSPRRVSGVQGGKIEKASPTEKRTSANSALWEAMQAMDDMNFEVSQPARRATDPMMPVSGMNKRRRKGETMSMLLDSGFFPIKDGKLLKPTSRVGLRVNVPGGIPPHMMTKELPHTPNSILASPKELSPRVSRPMTRPVTRRRVGPKRRSPLAQVPATSAKANSKLRYVEEMSPTRLAAIPETTSMKDNSPTPSGGTTPTVTSLHLRGGSIITVTPPEMTAWQQHVYVQGPIKLPTPVIMPRKNSVASLEPFQEAIDQVYQDALNVSRRRSDDAVEEDIVEWFDEFGFEDVKFAGDVLEVEDIELGEMHDVNDDDSHELEKYSTPPIEPVTTPMERVVAKEVVTAEITKAMLSPLPKPPIPPVETEETLRARGIARLTHHVMQARKESMALPSSDIVNVLPLLPAPEQSMLSQDTHTHRASVPSEAEEHGLDRVQSLGGQAFDRDNVEEMDPGPTWVALRLRPGSNIKIKRCRRRVLEIRCNRCAGWWRPLQPCCDAFAACMILFIGEGR